MRRMDNGTGPVNQEAAERGGGGQSGYDNEATLEPSWEITALPDHQSISTPAAYSGRASNDSARIPYGSFIHYSPSDDTGASPPKYEIKR